jgi:hypothetical protein
MTQETSEWVLLRQFSNPAVARMTVDFLRDSGIRFELRGDTPDVVPSLYTPIDIRIVVPAEEFEAAREALDAFTAEPALETPFRSVIPPEARDDGAPMPVAKKHGAFGFVLAFLGLVLPPLGGAGHFYAHHNVTGLVLCVANVASVAALLLLPGFPIALHVAIVLADALFAFSAVKRYTNEAIPSRGEQTVLGLGLVAVAGIVTFLYTGFFGR